LKNFISKANRELGELSKLLEAELESDQIKSLALGKQGLEDLKKEFEEANRLIKHAYTVAQAVKQDNNSKTLDDLISAITAIENKQRSMALQADSPKFRFIREIAYALAGLVGVLWSLVMKMGILAATSPLVMWAPSVTGIAIIFIRTGHLIKVHIIDAKCTEDIRHLSNLYASLLPILKGIKKKMKIEHIFALKEGQERLTDTMDTFEKNTSAEFAKVMKELQALKEAMPAKSPQGTAENAGPSQGKKAEDGANLQLQALITQKLQENPEASKESILAEVTKTAEDLFDQIKAAKAKESAETPKDMHQAASQGV
jgi:hypothetical protein